MLFKYQNSLIDDIKIKEQGHDLADYIGHLNEVAAAQNYQADESSLNLPLDNALVDQVQDLKRRLVNLNLKYFILIGIGGSNLGTKAIYDALYGHFDMLEPERLPKIIFIDTTDPDYINKLIIFFQNNITTESEFLINCVSKSGGTTESIANLEVIMDTVGQKFAVDQRTVITTDNGSQLYKIANEKGLHILTIPDKIGGRYSVFSAVGLFPLAVCGLDVAALHAGAAQIREQCLHKEILDNPAAISALILYLHSQNGKSINDNFFFNPSLHSLGLWYRQLMGESIGKAGKGITPTVSIGSTDLHSVAQLYLGGPKDKTTTFIYAPQTEMELKVPENDKRFLPNLIEGIEEKSLVKIMFAILEGVKSAYKSQNLPFTEINLDNISEKSLGEFMQFKMIEMMYLGHLMGVNTFNQPDVESYKSETRRMLEQTQSLKS